MSDNATLSARVAEEIRVAMTRRRISGRQLAGQLGMSQTWLASRLNGITPIDLNDLERIAAILNVEVMDLMPRDREGRLITSAGSPPETGRVSNGGKKRPPKRPHPNGYQTRKAPRDATRRPVRSSSAHAALVSGGVIPMRTDHEQGVTYGA